MTGYENESLDKLLELAKGEISAISYFSNPKKFKDMSYATQALADAKAELGKIIKQANKILQGSKTLKSHTVAEWSLLISGFNQNTLNTNPIYRKFKDLLNERLKEHGKFTPQNKFDVFILAAKNEKEAIIKLYKNSNQLNASQVIQIQQSLNRKINRLSENLINAFDNIDQADKKGKTALALFIFKLGEIQKIVDTVKGNGQFQKLQQKLIELSEEHLTIGKLDGSQHTSNRDTVSPTPSESSVSTTSTSGPRLTPKG